MRRRRFAPATDSAVLAQSSNPGRSSKSPSPPNEETPQVRGFLIWRRRRDRLGPSWPSPLRGAVASLPRPIGPSWPNRRTVGSHPNPLPHQTKKPRWCGAFSFGGEGGIDSGHPGPRRYAAPSLRSRVRLGRPGPIVEPWALIQIPFPTKRKSPAGAGLSHLAEKEGFEPSRGVNPNTLSRRAP